MADELPAPAAAGAAELKEDGHIPYAYGQLCTGAPVADDVPAPAAAEVEEDDEVDELPDFLRFRREKRRGPAWNSRNNVPSGRVLRDLRGMQSTRATHLSLPQSWSDHSWRHQQHGPPGTRATMSPLAGCCVTCEVCSLHEPPICLCAGLITSGDTNSMARLELAQQCPLWQGAA